MSEITDWDYVAKTSDLGDGGGGNADFTVLPKGEYDFTIKTLKHEIYQPKAGKTTGITTSCKMMKLGIIIEGAAGECGWVDENLYCHPKSLWRAFAILRSIGAIKSDEEETSVGEHIDEFVGGQGRCKVDVETYTGRDGTKKTRNVIKSYLKVTPVNPEDCPY